jgi:hypothetical protein
VYRIAETSLISLSPAQQRIDMSTSDNTAEKRLDHWLQQTPPAACTDWLTAATAAPPLNAIYLMPTAAEQRL